jgi:hypothetical protein
MEAVIFTNFTDEDFVQNYGGTPQVFKARTSTWMEKPMAEFFAKHLVDKELNRLNLSTMAPERAGMLVKCGLTAEPVVEAAPVVKSDEQVKIEIVNLNKEAEVAAEVAPEVPADLEVPAGEAPFCDFCSSKGVRHLKVCTRPITD